MNAIRVMVAAGSAALAVSAQAQVLIGSTAVSGGVSTIVRVDPVTGVITPFMTVPVPQGFELWYLSARPPCGLAGTIYRGDASTNRSRLVVIDPAARTSQTIEFAAPLNTSYSEGFDWSPRHNAFMIGFGPLGNFATTRLALVDATGAVLSTSGALPVGDIDSIASTATLDTLWDLNRTTTPRVYQLSALFPTPAVSAFSSPPSKSGWYDVAAHPDTGDLIFVDTSGDRLVYLRNNAYVNGPAFTTGTGGGVGILRGLAWAHLAPIVLTPPQDAPVCPTGTVSFAVGGIFDEPTTYRWQRQAGGGGGGGYVDVQDGVAAWAAGSATVEGSGTATLRITAVAGRTLDAGVAVRYRCVVTNTCGSESSAGGLLVLCPADFTCDGFVDGFDYDDYVAEFESGGPRADFNHDGFPDAFDYDDFVTAFEAGC